MKHKKPTWDQIWMLLAESVADKSHDPRNKVGSVIVTEDNTCVLGLGYNGAEKGGKNEPDSSEPGKSGFIHAEANALLKFNFGDYRNKKMYVTCAPCVVCARMIVNADIKTVIYRYDYRDRTGLEILEESGINLVRV